VIGHDFHSDNDALQLLSSAFQESSQIPFYWPDQNGQRPSLSGWSWTA